MNASNMNSTYLQTPYALTDPNAKMASVVPTNSGAASSRYVPVYKHGTKSRLMLRQKMREAIIYSKNVMSTNQ